VAGLALLGLGAPARAASPIRFGLTPVFVSDDVVLLARLQAYLENATGQSVELVTRRTYQEITALLVSAQLDAAWICGFPFVRFRDRLDLVAVPLWCGAPLYRSYIISRRERALTDWHALAGDVHAFSDPDSNSGWLATAALLARSGAPPPDRFFGRTFYTYGHRNVVRAVGSGLADSGSVDGYVFDVLAETEPEIAAGLTVVHRSAWHGFPPVAASRAGDPARVAAIRAALRGMAADPVGEDVLARLRLDGFAEEPRSLYDSIAAMVDSVGLAG
jgi:phosphonate transport system substrate-binding protein